jgi:hypothetical protein
MSAHDYDQRNDRVQQRAMPDGIPMRPPQAPTLPSRRPVHRPRFTLRQRRRLYFTVMFLLFGFPALVSLGYGSPMAVVWLFLYGFFAVCWHVAHKKPRSSGQDSDDATSQ